METFFKAAALNDGNKGDFEMTEKLEKDPEVWISGDDPMTDAQASYLKTLSEQAGRPVPREETLTKAEASQMIDKMRRAAGLD